MEKIINAMQNWNVLVGTWMILFLICGGMTARVWSRKNQMRSDKEWFFVTTILSGWISLALFLIFGV